MPLLAWNEADFTDCLEVLPKVDREWEVLHVFDVEKSNLLLSLGVRQLESTISVVVRQIDNEKPTISFLLFVKGAARFVKERRGEFLELQQCVLLPCERSPFAWGIDVETFPCHLDVEISIKPSIEVRIKNHSPR
jgi:hypothetical protein